MNDKQKLELAKKYFIEQKKEEISCFMKKAGKFLLYLLPMIIIPFLIGHYFTDGISSFCGGEERFAGPQQCGVIGQWFLGMTIVIYWALIIGTICVVVGFIVWCIYDWLNENWNRAKKRAGLK